MADAKLWEVLKKGWKILPKNVKNTQKLHKNGGILWYILKKGSIKIFPSCKVINREGVLIILITRVVIFSENVRQRAWSFHEFT